MGYGSRCQTHLFEECQELQRCWVFHAQQFPVCIKNGPPLKGHPANLTKLWEALESTWASSPVERIQHLVHLVYIDTFTVHGKVIVHCNHWDFMYSLPDSIAGKQNPSSEPVQCTRLAEAAYSERFFLCDSQK